MKAVLLLEDGRAFEGTSAGTPGTAFGEVVFNTALSGYQETLTDPSYRGQIVVMTASHVGNYGLNDEDAESSRIQVAGYVARHFPETYSNPRGKRSIHEALTEAGVVGIHGVDTRALVRHLRSGGVLRGAISTAHEGAEGRAALLEAIRAQPEMAGAALALEVGTRVPYAFEPAVHADKARPRVAAIDYGIKTNILKLLTEEGFAVTVFPAETSAATLLDPGAADGRPFAGFFLSNGPGDPAALTGCVQEVKGLVDSGRPVFGICLGHQLLGLAVGASTFKLKFGHRGVNHPVKDVESGAVSITSQNHGFAVDPATLPANAELTHVNLNDGTCEGFRLKDRPVFAVQYHPESAPGPHDSSALFAAFSRDVRANP